MTEAKTTDANATDPATGVANGPEAAAAAAAARPKTVAASVSKARPSAKLALIGCSAVVVVLLVLVAVLRPFMSATHVAPDPVPDAKAAEPGAPDTPDEASDAGRFAGSDGPCSRPASGAGIAMLVQADAAYEEQDFQRARDLYLDLLLSGGDFGEDGESIVSWAHGRLALSMARIVRATRKPLLDEPALLFREGSR